VLLCSQLLSHANVIYDGSIRTFLSFVQNALPWCSLMPLTFAAVVGFQSVDQAGIFIHPIVRFLNQSATGYPFRLVHFWIAGMFFCFC
jgi:hypothetical protein